MTELEQKTVEAFDAHAVLCPKCGDSSSPACCPLGHRLLMRAERAMHMAMAVEERVQ